LIALATVCGAFGAHALQGVLPPERLAAYETAVRYHFFHALGLAVIGLVARNGATPLLYGSAALVTLGIVLFSGSIYALSFGAPRWLGPVTPVGGGVLISAWMVFAIAILRG
jgi:uncharacterized membrane protein YgdD (TMEM256/DUF423 family)